MKNMFKYAAAAVILSASLVSCELDNYDGPNAQIYGEVRDSKTGALIQQDINGTKIMYEELGFENPDRQQMIFKVSGEYRNNLMFAAKYDIYFEESNFVIPDRLEGYEIKRGENRLDFEVQPYIRISNASIRKEGSEIVATFTVTPTVDSNVRAVGLFGHIDYIVKRAIGLGVDPITAVKVACHNAARYFLLNNRGGISPGYLADFVIIDNFQDFNIEQVYKKGVLMVDHGEIQDFPSPEIEPYLVERAHKTFHVAALTAEDFAEKRPRGIIGMVDGEITTVDAGYSDRIDVEYDVLKIAVVERHKNTHHIGIGYIQGYGLKSGAVATSISHDSHNIIVVGTNETDMAAAVNRVVELNGGIVVWDGGQSVAEVPLAIAGIMSDEPLVTVNEKLETAKDAAHKLGVNPGIDPFMTLSFMALPVIPSLRITTRGVFDVTTQSYV